METLENKPEIGVGIYTTSDISKLLRIPYSKVNRWIRNYWDIKFGENFTSRYSWNDGNSTAVSFHTLIELYTFFQLTESGVNYNKIINSHEILSFEYNTRFPFANEKVLKDLNTDGYNIYFQIHKNHIVNVDKSYQLNLAFIKDFFKKIDFDGNDLATQLWPLGKDKSIIVTPENQFGQPIIVGTNILAENIYRMYKAEESTSFISSMYKISIDQINDAISLFDAA